MEDESTLQAIHRLYPEIVESSSKIREITADLKDIAEQNDEYRGLKEDIAELKNKQRQAKTVLQNDSDYQHIKSELEELKFRHKDLLEILSHHLNAYHDETGSDVVKDPEGEARRIIRKAKLSKPDPLLVDGGTARSSNKPIPGQVTMESQIQGYGNPGGKPAGGRSYGITSNKSDKKLVIDKEGTRSEPLDSKSLAAGEGKD